jgi:hypothetical protein
MQNFSICNWKIYGFSDSSLKAQGKISLSLTLFHQMVRLFFEQLYRGFTALPSPVKENSEQF